VLALLWITVLVAASTARAALRILGRGNPRLECYVGVEAEGRKQQRGCNVMYHTLTTTRGGVRVHQESCGNECEFNLKVCLNLETPGCSPTTIERVFVIGDTDGVALPRPATPTKGSACGTPLVPVRLVLGPTQQRVTRRLTLLARGRGRPRRDRDVVTLVCERSSRSCCGNGVVEEGEGETCDVGNPVDGDACDTNCTRPGCGNCVLGASETCDDGNRANGDACDEDCTPPRCGNGIVAVSERGTPEQCDVADDACGCGFYCDAECQCRNANPCGCFDSDSWPLGHDNVLTFTVGAGEGLCGLAADGFDPPQQSLDLECGKLYVGGGTPHGVLPAAVPAGATIAITATCDGDTMRLSKAGGMKGCTEPGCLFGRPFPVPGAADACLLVSFSSGVSGEVDCNTWGVTMKLPLRAEVFFDGCPSCPDDAAFAESCSTVGVRHVATIELPDFNLATAPVTDSEPSGQFAGYCRQEGYGCFAGDPNAGCPGPWNGVAIECTGSSECEQPFGVCEQRSAGAFGQDLVRALRLDGRAPMTLGDGEPRDARLVGIFRVPPSFAAAIDPLSSLPGPGAVGLDGTLHLQAAPKSTPHCP
jgi:hypothetical protein